VGVCLDMLPDKKVVSDNVFRAPLHRSGMESLLLFSFAGEIISL
jgi:hypothetical protein